MSRIGLSVEDWKKLSINEFDCWPGETIAERIRENEVGRVIVAGSVGKFISSGDKGSSQSITFCSDSSSSCSRKRSGWSSEI